MSRPLQMCGLVSSRSSFYEWTNGSLKLTDKSAEADCLTELRNSQDVVLVGEDEWAALKNKIVFDWWNEGLKEHSGLNDLPLRVKVMSGNELVVLQLNMYSPAAIGKAPSLVLILVTSSFGPVERERELVNHVTWYRFKYSKLTSQQRGASISDSLATSIAECGILKSNATKQVDVGLDLMFIDQMAYWIRTYPSILNCQ